MDFSRQRGSYDSPYISQLGQLAINTTLVSVTFTLLPAAWWLALLVCLSTACVMNALVAVRHGLAHWKCDGESTAWRAQRRRWRVGSREDVDVHAVVRPVAWVLRRRMRSEVVTGVRFFGGLGVTWLLLSGSAAAIEGYLGGLLGVYLVLAVCMVTSHRWQARKRAEVEQAGGMVRLSV